MREIFVARQPIFDRTLRVYAYELLFRGDRQDRANFTDGDQATSELILNTFTEFGLEQIVGRHLAFINLTRDFILHDHAICLPPDKVVLEFLEHVPVNPEIIAAIERLIAHGFTIALDDFIYREDLRPLMRYASLIKIDVQALTRESVVEHVERLRSSGVKLLAEKVETSEELDFCKSLGFDYFQGYFLSRPTLFTGRRPPANRVAALQLLARLQDPNIEISDLKDLISQDISLAYRVLRYINSAYTSLHRQVDSIQAALQLLGLNHLRQLAALIALSQIDDKPRELIGAALIRAKMCELYAEALAHPNRDMFFTVGLFSLLDALLDMPLSEVLGSLPLNDEIAAALLRHEGPAGTVLRSVLAYERGEWEAVYVPGLAEGDIRNLYVQSLAWADHTTATLL